MNLNNPDTANVMHKVDDKDDVHYASTGGMSARCEQGDTPNGNPVGGRWVLRDASGRGVDLDQYRHDLFERNGLRTNY